MRRFLTGMLMTAFTVASGFLMLNQPISAQQISASDMAKKMPGSINSIMVVNVEGIKNSAISKKEGWADTHAGKVVSGLIFLPDSAKEIVMGAVMDYDAFHPRQTALLATMDKVPTLNIIQQFTDGSVDELLGYQFVETNHDMYVVPISENLVGGLRPALRPFFGNWLSALKNDKVTDVGEYLEKGLDNADEFGTEVILAFDLKHVISRSQVMNRIRNNEVVRQNALDPKVVSGLIASAEGLTLGITVKDTIYGAVLIDFAEDISSLKPIAKNLAEAVLNKSGLHLDEFASWNVDAGPHQVKLSGDLSTQSLRKLLSIVDAPNNQSMSQPAGSQADTAAANMSGPAAATKKYFDAVNSLVDELRPNLSAGTAYTRNAHWLKQYADKIGALGTLDVDPDMIDYGDYVAQQLREAQMTLVETNETSQELNRDLIAAGTKSGGAGGRGGWGTSYNRYGWYGGASGYRRRISGGDGSRLRRTVRENQKSQAITSATQIFSQIATSETQIRQEMTAKYNVQF